MSNQFQALQKHAFPDPAGTSAGPSKGKSVLVADEDTTSYKARKWVRKRQRSETTKPSPMRRHIQHLFKPSLRRLLRNKCQLRQAVPKLSRV
ncbi:D-glycero-alpha-D-manno-heptose 1-phosphate guanylyltransferase [Sesbania bispinosa]|nr:D-glycero-alpha-D-manno-heptose 1-phosphate guanylyltransferase [Sesbania bispinosa]